ncbi:MAG: glycosyltransferase family 2 protein [Bryobacteraceae bacterium]
MALVSLILPAYNEAENLPELRRRLAAVTAALPGHEFEFLLIDNASADATPALGEQFAAEDPRWRFLRFSRNFGAEISLAAGLRYARGEAAVLIATDLQDPPEKLPEMIALWEQGYQVVYGQLARRADGNPLKTIGVRIAYWLIHRLSDVRIPPNATDFRLLARPVVDAVNQCREQNRYLRGLVQWVGFRQVGFPYDRAERKAGQSTANVLFCLQYAFNAILAFSSQPLRLATYAGLLTMSGSILGAVAYTGIYIAYRLGWLAYGPPPGWTTITLALFFLIGLQSVFMGLLGEYIANIYRETKERPLWVVDRVAGFEGGAPGLGRLARAVEDPTRHALEAESESPARPGERILR